jgi:vacuolar-type H+-ATPase subunit I/STV1
MSKQLHPEDLLDRLQSLEGRIDDLEAENERLREGLADAKTTAGEDRAAIRQQLNDEVAALQDDLETEQRQRGLDDSRILRRLSAVEDEVGIDSEAAMQAAAAGRGQAMTALARLLQFGPEAAVENPSAKHYRARVIAEKLDGEEWGRRVRRGSDRYRQLCSAKDDLRTRLSDARDEDLQWNQVYRAMKTVADLSEGTVTLRDGTDEEGTYVLEVPLIRSGGDD